MTEVFTPEALEDPYPVYKRLRGASPVHRLAESGIWLVTRHADVEEAAGKPEIFSSHISAIFYAGQGPNPVVIPADPEAIGAVDVLATQDPPAHTVQRKLLYRWFVASEINAMTPLVGRLVEESLAAPLASGRIEWMSAVANPVPVTVIARMLGFPQADRAALSRWADAGVDLLSGVASQERMLAAWQEMIELLAYLRERIAAPAGGTITADIARGVVDGTLTDREGVSLLLQLLIAGSESTTSLMGTAVRILAERPALQDALRADPSRIRAFLEETLRYESPFRGHFRVVTQDTTLGGVALKTGERVMLMWGAANRDPDAFERPDAFDVERPHPKAHLAFGSGIHFCIGAPLARMETRVALGTLLSRTASFTLAEPVRHVPSLFVRRLAAVPLEAARR